MGGSLNTNKYSHIVSSGFNILNENINQQKNIKTAQNIPTVTINVTELNIVDPDVFLDNLNFSKH